MRLGHARTGVSRLRAPRGGRGGANNRSFANDAAPAGKLGGAAGSEPRREKGRDVTQGLQYEIMRVMPEAAKMGRFESLCTIQAPDGSLGASGFPSGAYVNVAGLVGIACQDAPPSLARIQATEAKSLAEILALNMRHVLLDGYYPTISKNTEWRAVITAADGSTVTVYDIMGAESDSQAQLTRLEVRLVTQ